MQDHRLVGSTSLACVDMRRPFSNFDFVERHFRGTPSIRRLFSQARARGSATLVVEDIPAAGIIRAENQEIKALFPGFRAGGLKRLSFWRCRPSEVSKADPSKLLGYAIVKRDLVAGIAVPDASTPRQTLDVLPAASIGDLDQWHVFESTFVAWPPREHNYVPGARNYPVAVGQRRFEVPGVMFCQQNHLNKACAQVALRTLCSLHRSDLELGYDRLNQLAGKSGTRLHPAQGLGVVQIRAVLDGLGIGYRDVDYTTQEPSYRRELPYQKLLYAGVESGAGALLGFKLTGPGAVGQRHMIAFFGHTSNQDAWVPNAETAYFHVGEHTRYVPSEAWVSSFIGHDDNFGSDYCVPRLYVTPEQVDYAVALLPHDTRYCGVVAEAVAADYLYSVLPNVTDLAQPWLVRLVETARRQELVLRAIPVSRPDYIEHLRTMQDWELRNEDAAFCDALAKHLPARLWMVEVSVPELFPTNERKLGEIVLDAGTRPAANFDFRAFLFARFPGQFLFIERISSRGKPSFVPVPSRLLSHTPLLATRR